MDDLMGKGGELLGGSYFLLTISFVWTMEFLFHQFVLARPVAMHLQGQMWRGLAAESGGFLGLLVVFGGVSFVYSCAI